MALCFSSKNITTLSRDIDCLLIVTFEKVLIKSPIFSLGAGRESEMKCLAVSYVTCFPCNYSHYVIRLLYISQCLIKSNTGDGFVSYFLTGQRQVVLMAE